MSDDSEGQLWTAKLPSGETGVFWSHPRLGEWHRLIAKFPSETRARIYVTKETALLEHLPPDLREDVPEEVNADYEVASNAFTDREKEWLREQQPVFAKTTTARAPQSLDDEEMLPDDFDTSEFRDDSDDPAGLTSIRKQILMAMQVLAHDDGICRVGYKAISDKSGANYGSMNYHLKCLEALGCIQKIELPGRRPMYRILDTRDLRAA